MSEHEAIYRILSIPLRESNMSVTYVPTDFKHECLRLVKSKKQIQTLEDDDTDIYPLRIVDKYSAHPDSLEDMCLAEFATSFTYDSSKKECDDVDPPKEIDANSSNVKLKYGRGVMKRREKPNVLRYHFVSEKVDREKYFHRFLILYFPWRQEED